MTHGEPRPDYYVCRLHVLLLAFPLDEVRLSWDSDISFHSLVYSCLLYHALAEVQIGKIRKARCLDLLVKLLDAPTYQSKYRI